MIFNNIYFYGLINTFNNVKRRQPHRNDRTLQSILTASIYTCSRNIVYFMDKENEVFYLCYLYILGSVVEFLIKLII